MIFRSPIFRKLLASAILLIAVSVVTLDFYLTRYTSEREIASVQHKLESEARILSQECARLTPADLESWALAAGSRAQSRITIINPQGVVLADSEHDPETMENHAHRPEIMQAYQGRVGSSLRHSATLNRDLCYLAWPLTYRGQTGYVLRLAVPLEDVAVAIRAVRWRILSTSLVAALIALAIAYAFSRSFTRRIKRLRAFAEGLAEERGSGALTPEGHDELGALAGSLNRMGVQLRGLIERLSLESARRQAILSSMVEGVLAVDGDLRVTFCNDSFAHTVGARLPVAEGTPLLDLVRDPGLKEMLSHVLSTGQSVNERLQLAPRTTSNGQVFEIQAAPLAGPSRRGAIAILHDITDLERLERVRKDFVANVSHELRTPLTAIRGYAETLLEGGLEDQDNNRRFIEVIHTHSTRLGNIASDLLTLSDLESGKPAPEPERISVRTAIETSLRTVGSEARERGILLVKGQIEDAEVSGSRMHLEQVLVNLLSNGIKFNTEGGEVRIETWRAEGGKVCISVADTGIGIPSEHLPRIFERFYRVDKARSREMGGTGLGLSIVKHIVERMNASVTVTSQLGKGSTFTLVLPSC